MSAPTFTAGPAVTNTAGPAPAQRPRRISSRRGRALIVGFLAPALLVYVTFVLLPVVLAAVYSFFNWNGLSALDRFIGFDNYVRALTDPIFQAAVGRNLAIVGLSLALQGPLAIGIALLLNRRIVGRTVLRILIFVPFVLSEVIAGLSWKLLLQPQGPFDGVLESLGLGGIRQLWLADQNIVFWTLFVVLTWKSVSYTHLTLPTIYSV